MRGIQARAGLQRTVQTTKSTKKFGSLDDDKIRMLNLELMEGFYSPVFIKAVS